MCTHQSPYRGLLIWARSCSGTSTQCATPLFMQLGVAVLRTSTSYCSQNAFFVSKNCQRASEIGYWIVYCSINASLVCEHCTYMRKRNLAVLASNDNLFCWTHRGSPPAGVKFAHPNMLHFKQQRSRKCSGRLPNSSLPVAALVHTKIMPVILTIVFCFLICYYQKVSL